MNLAAGKVKNHTYQGDFVQGDERRAYLLKQKEKKKKLNHICATYNIYRRKTSACSVDVNQNTISN